MKLLCCALLVFTVLVAPPARAKDAKPSSPPHAPGFTLPTRAGAVSLDSLSGKLVLLDFWASWCVPCHKSFPWMAGLEQRYGARGLTIVAIDLDKDSLAAHDFLREVPAPFTVAFDPEGHTAKAYRVAGMPASVLVGPDGAILYAHVGFDPKKTQPLEALIEEHLP